MSNKKTIIDDSFIAFKCIGGRAIIGEGIETLTHEDVVAWSAPYWNTAKDGKKYRCALSRSNHGEPAVRFFLK